MARTIQYLLLAVSLVAVASLPVLQPVRANLPPGVETRAAFAAVGGQDIFRRNCASCHGARGQGGFGPSLHGLKLSAAQITSTIRQGKGDMPAFDGKLSGAQIRSVAAFILTL